MKVAVAAGKGGTGKTMIAVNLALALSAGGSRVRYLDLDVEEPNGGLFLSPSFEEEADVFMRVPVIDEARCDLCGDCARFCAFGALSITPRGSMIFPELCHDCGGCQMVCRRDAVTWEKRHIGIVERGRTPGGIDVIQGKLDVGEPKATPVIHAVKALADPLAVNILDCGPGTGCAVMASVRGADHCILVTEPTPFGLHDLRMAGRMVRDLGVDGSVVINKDDPQETSVRDFCK
ncbi:MAG: (4Fe-4S)-binding protein, partial [Deltaproteobacteria bacterium HGW-Deltaproteobacteria-17]